jgi:protocatechuate 3,4-dioxygenase alpha subunit
VLQSLPDEASRRTLIAQPSADGYVLDFNLQGEDETVFFAL